MHLIYIHVCIFYCTGGTGKGVNFRSGMCSSLRVSCISAGVMIHPGEDSMIDARCIQYKHDIYIYICVSI